MSIDKVQPDTLIEQAALSQLREQGPADNSSLSDIVGPRDTVSDDGPRAMDASALTDAVTTDPRTSQSLDAGDQLIASDAWQGIPAEARVLMDSTLAAQLEESGFANDEPSNVAQALDDAVSFVLTTPE